MIYKIDFEVDNGASFIKDSAIVLAHDAEEANKKLVNMINSINRLYPYPYVSKIYNTSIFIGNVFTGNHGWK